VIDTVMAACIWNVGLKYVTVNLNVNYRKFIPLDTTVIAEAYVEKLAGRKVYVNSVLKSLDEKVVHNEGSGVFFQVLLETKNNTP
jgi:acyl-coenzyme A thioesterase PaaI-like protein